jgi:hypothetical protein
MQLAGPSLTRSKKKENEMKALKKKIDEMLKLETGHVRMYRNMLAMHGLSRKQHTAFSQAVASHSHGACLLMELRTIIKETENGEMPNL